MNDEIRKLNEEIEELEDGYWEFKGDYEQDKANILLNTDWATAIGKAKPTVAEKDAYIEMELGDRRVHYHKLRNEIDMKKRLFQIMLKEIGDNE